MAAEHRVGVPAGLLQHRLLVIVRPSRDKFAAAIDVLRVAIGSIRHLIVILGPFGRQLSLPQSLPRRGDRGGSRGGGRRDGRGGGRGGSRGGDRGGGRQWGPLTVRLLRLALARPTAHGALALRHERVR